jgi:RNA polymerase sigma-70 factor (ECF subfamily)
MSAGAKGNIGPRMPPEPDENHQRTPGERAVDVTVTELLRRHRAAQPGAADQLYSAIYPELRRLARALMRRERVGHTLQPTELVHDAFMRLVDQTAIEVCDRVHFLAVAARAMRQILVDHARRRGAQKRGGLGWERVTLNEEVVCGPAGALELLAFDQALDALTRQDARAAQVVEMKIFAGLTSVEIADALGVSKRTVDGDWALGRLWIARAIKEGIGGS